MELMARCGCGCGAGLAEGGEEERRRPGGGEETRADSGSADWYGAKLAAMEVFSQGWIGVLLDSRWRASGLVVVVVYVVYVVEWSFFVYKGEVENARLRLNVGDGCGEGGGARGSRG